MILGTTRTRPPQRSLHFSNQFVPVTGCIHGCMTLFALFNLLTMSALDELIPKDLKVTIPEHAADVGRWMRQNGCIEEVIEVIVGK